MKGNFIYRGFIFGSNSKEVKMVWKGLGGCLN